MTDVGGKLGNVIEMMSLAWWVSIRLAVESEGEGFVIGENVKWTTFEEMTEVFDNRIYIQREVLD